jgi:hypothetical protein
MAWPELSPSPPLESSPPKYVEYLSALTSALTSATKASSSPEMADCTAPEVVGKSGDLVVPVTKAPPAESTAIPLPCYHVRRNEVARKSHAKTWRAKHRGVKFLRL